MALIRKVPAKIYEIQAHSLKVTCLEIGETGRVLVTGGTDRNVNLFAFGNDACSMSLEGHNSKIETVKFACSDDFVYSSDETGVIRKWDLNQGENNAIFYGHMKSVRTLDYHPFGDYLVSGSNDTSVRLWDVRTNQSIKKYRGHIANVNSVKFSPDGSWIASAGTEGSVIIWDIRMSNKLIEFIENGSPVTSLQFHPGEFLLAAGRNDGSVDLYDLESKQMISRTDRTNSSSSCVKCITFSEQGECLFVGSIEAVSVIGWEPDREFDRIESTWNFLGDMKVVNGKLICGGFENRNVTVHAMDMDRIFPFYNPTSLEKSFNQNQSSRKSFNKNNGKLQLSVSAPKKSSTANSNEDTLSMETSGSPNLSIEMIDEEADLDDSVTMQPSNFEFASYALSKYKNSIDYGNNLTSNVQSQEKYQLSKIIGDNETTTIVHGFPLHGDTENFSFKQSNVDIGYSSDLDYYSQRNILNNVSDNEDFPVNSAQPPDYAPKLRSSAASHTNKKATAKTTIENRRSSPPNMTTTSNFKISSLRKNSTSVSTVDLRKVDEQFLNLSTSLTNKKEMSRGTSPVRDINKIKKSESSYQIGNRDIHHSTHHSKNKNVTVQFFSKPVRSKTSIDIKASGRTIPSSIPRSIPVQQQQQQQQQQLPQFIQQKPEVDKFFTTETIKDTQEYQYLIIQHDLVFNALCNRLTSLELIRNQTRSQDMAGALRTAARIKDDSVFVDLLGAILEKKSSWNLDMCLLVLPKIYDLIQSEYKFHCIRACDTLRIIIKEFLPVIQQNIDPWSPARCLGVDITREERQRKCIECRNLLIKIRHLPSNEKIGSTLTQLQNLIVDI